MSNQINFDKKSYTIKFNEKLWLTIDNLLNICVNYLIKNIFEINWLYS